MRMQSVRYTLLCGLSHPVSLALGISLHICTRNMNVFRHFVWVCSSEKRTRTHSLTRAQPCKVPGDFCCPVNAPSPIFLSYSFVVCGIPAVVAVIGLASGAKCDGRIMVTRGKQSKQAITQMQHTTPRTNIADVFKGIAVIKCDKASLLSLACLLARSFFLCACVSPSSRPLSFRAHSLSPARTPHARKVSRWGVHWVAALFHPTLCQIFFGAMAAINLMLIGFAFYLYRQFSQPYQGVNPQVLVLAAHSLSNLTRVLSP